MNETHSLSAMSFLDKFWVQFYVMGGLGTSSQKCSNSREPLRSDFSTRNSTQALSQINIAVENLIIVRYTYVLSVMYPCKLLESNIVYLKKIGVEIQGNI
jgi:hypothetical protein